MRKPDDILAPGTVDDSAAFGHFDDDRCEYVVTDPATPWPWINYLGSDTFFSLLSNTGGGYCFYRDPKFRRLTRYRYNNVPSDDGGRYFYVRDGDAVWSPGWKPCRTPLDDYECRHGMGYSVISGEKDGIRVEVLFFVPPGDAVEIQRVRVENRSGRRRELRLFSLVEWCLWNAEDDMSNFQRNYSTGEVRVDGSTIYHVTEYRERRDHFAFYTVNAPVVGFDTDRDAFLGPYNGFDRPDAVRQGASRNSMAHGWSPIASHAVDVSLAPGERRDLVYQLGYVENPADGKWAAPGVIDTSRAEALVNRYDSSNKVDRALAALAGDWDDMLSRFRVSSADARLDRMVNAWNAYQCMVTFNLSRSASYFEAGLGRGMGFRDSNQDLLGSIHLVPERARERILDIAATQFEDGAVFHQYQPLTKRGNADIGGNFNDDPLWLILSTTAYLRETGDVSILEESVPWENDASRTAPLFEHLKASFDHVVRKRGPHGLPLIGRADWNDCLNLNCHSTDPDESFQTTGTGEGDVAESMFIAAQFVLYGSEYAKLCRRLGRDGEATRAEGHVETMRDAIADHGWDGEWWLRAYDAEGRKVGSRDSEGSEIFIEPQGFCVMAGLGLDDGRAERALASVEQRLACEFGIVLNAPAYRHFQPELGEIGSYPPGYKENGGIFCHNNPWIMIAETVLGRGDRAWDYYCRIAPAFQAHVALRKVEPYVYAQMVAGPEAATPGQAKNSWLTGTAAWNWHAVTEHILGIRPDYDGLRVNPCIPAAWPGFDVTRRFRGATYHIRVRNPEGVSKGVAAITVDGSPVDGMPLPLAKPGSECRVEVVMGAADI